MNISKLSYSKKTDRNIQQQFGRQERSPRSATHSGIMAAPASSLHIYPELRRAGSRHSAWGQPLSQARAGRLLYSS
nr:hypothetical protein Q903MT_gene2103 [Picea sitchensis]